MNATDKKFIRDLLVSSNPVGDEYLPRAKDYLSTLDVQGMGELNFRYPKTFLRNSTDVIARLTAASLATSLKKLKELEANKAGTAGKEKHNG